MLEKLIRKEFMVNLGTVIKEFVDELEIELDFKSIKAKTPIVTS